MALTVSPAEIVDQVSKSIAAGLDGTWVTTAVEERVAILGLDEVKRWIAGAFPLAAVECETVSKRHLAASIFTPTTRHRFEFIGQACGDAAGVGGTSASWIFVGHVCAEGEKCGKWLQTRRQMEESRFHVSGQRAASLKDGRMLVLAVWKGPHSPIGCPDCQTVPKDRRP